MSSGRARDIRYGRRGGGWIDGPPRWTPSSNARAGRVAVVLDPEVLFHPDTIAARRAHDRQCSGPHGDSEQCPALVDADDRAAVWAGRARMARGRRAAGRPLDRIDRAALAGLDDQQGRAR